MPFHLIRCSSEDRMRGTLSSFTVDFSALPRTQQVLSIRVKYIGFTNTQTNIHSGNNTFSITDSTFGRFTFTIPAGQYTADELASEITTVISTARPAWGFSMALINANLNPRFQFTSIETLNYMPTVTAPESTLSDVLGILDEDFGLYNNYISEYPPNLIGLKQVFLHSKSVALSRAMNPTQGFNAGNDAISLAIVSVVPVNVAYGEYVNYEPHIENRIDYTTPTNLSRIEFRLRMQQYSGRLVDLTFPGVSITLEIETI